MAKEAAARAEETRKIKSFEFQMLDPNFMDPKTEKRCPLQFSFEGVFIELQHAQTYEAKDLPAGVDVEALVHHLNSRCRYPVYEWVERADRNGVMQKVTALTGYKNRVRCINLEYLN